MKSATRTIANEAGSLPPLLTWLGIGAVLLVAAFAVPTAYRMGINRGKNAAAYGWKGSVVNSLNALEKWDNGETNQALAVMRNHLYASAMTLLEDPENRDTIKLFLPDLRQY